MAYSSEEARRKLLDDVAEATDQLAFSLACLGEAYEALDERTADRLEEYLFRPVQAAYGRLKRTHAEFAGRHGLATRTFASASAGTHAADPGAYIERAVDAAEGADHGIGTLQDSMLPVEVGDQALRAGLSESRELIAAVPLRGRQLLRTLGR